MQYRKLKKHEHEKTRTLWEEVFPEDTKEFLDYYYSYKATENEIYVVEEDGEICSMLHLNPYRMQIGERVEVVHYIVAVGTKKEYRHKGFMKTLLDEVLDVMYKRGEPFTYLMPANEAIYAPFDFTTVYKQQYYQIKDEEAWMKNLKEQDFEFVDAIDVDCEDVAKFMTSRLKRRYQIYSVRNKFYYETLLREQTCQKGGIMMVKKEGKLVGGYLYAKESVYEVREPLFMRKYEKMLMNGIEKYKTTNIMVRPLCTENLGTIMDGLYLNEIV